MKNQGWNQKKFLVDGFPRNQDNQEGWDRVMSAHVDMKFVLFLDCEEQTMIERITSRAEQHGENARNDDNLDVLVKRFTVFRDQSMPIVKLYQERDKVRTINANQTSSQVYEDVLKAFEGYL